MVLSHDNQPQFRAFAEKIGLDFAKIESVDQYYPEFATFLKKSARNIQRIRNINYFQSVSAKLEKIVAQF
jgi:hypothetical protein